MSSKLTEQYAQRIADRIGPIVGFDPFLILIAVLGLVMQCWSFQNREVSQQELHDKLAEACSTPEGRDRVIKRAAKQFRRKSETQLSKAEARILAEASIDEALASPPDEMREYAVACGMPPESEQVHFQSEADDE
jgi:hypothetical protein